MAGLVVCVGAQGSCAVVDSVSKISGGIINIRDCGTQGKCYDGGIELFKVSQNAADRQEPSASLGNILAASNFYNPSASSSYAGAPTGVAINYDSDKYGLRSKTSVELGLCTTIPQATCAAEGNYSEDNGYAYWPETLLGAQATGTCKLGWHAVLPLNRYCIPFPQTKTFGFEPLYKIVHEVLINRKEYSNVKCIKD